MSSWHYRLTCCCLSSILNAALELDADRVEEADMPTPFPGMDPYLEQPGLWREVHTRLIVAIADALGPMVRPHYRVAVEQRRYLAMLTSDETVIVPDVSVTNGGGTSSSSSPQLSLSPSSAERACLSQNFPCRKRSPNGIWKFATPQLMTSLPLSSCYRLPTSNVAKAEGSTKKNGSMY
jgi:hypothetical protein